MVRTWRKFRLDKISTVYTQAANPVAPYSDLEIETYLASTHQIVDYSQESAESLQSNTSGIYEDFTALPDWLKILRIEYWDKNFLASRARISRELTTRNKRETIASGFYERNSRELWFDKNFYTYCHEIGHFISEILGKFILETNSNYSGNPEWLLALEKELNSPQAKDKYRLQGYCNLKTHLFQKRIVQDGEGKRREVQHYDESEYPEEAFAVTIQNYLMLHRFYEGDEEKVFEFLKQDVPLLFSVFRNHVLPALKEHAAYLVGERKKKIEKIQCTMTRIAGLGLSVIPYVKDPANYKKTGSILYCPIEEEALTKERAAGILLAGFGPDSGKRLASLESYVLCLRSFFEEEGYEGLLDTPGEFDELLYEFLDPLSTNTYINFVEFSETYGLRDGLKSVFEKAMRGYFESFTFLHEVGNNKASHYVRNEIDKNIGLLNGLYPLNGKNEDKIKTLKDKFNFIYSNIGYYKRHEYLSRKLKKLLDCALLEPQLEDWDLSQLSLASYKAIVSVLGDLKSRKPFIGFNDDDLLSALEYCLNSEDVKDYIISRLSDTNDNDHKYKSKALLLESVIRNIILDFFPRYGNENPVAPQEALPRFTALAA